MVTIEDERKGKKRPKLDETQTPEQQLPQPKGPEDFGAGSSSASEKAILQQIEVPGAVEVPLDKLEKPPAGIRFLNPAVEDMQLGRMMGKQANIVLIGSQDVDVTSNLRRQLEFYREQLKPHLGDAPAAEVIHTKNFVGDQGFVEKFVLEKNGDITKVTAGSTMMLSSMRKVRLTPDDHLHIEMETEPRKHKSD